MLYNQTKTNGMPLPLLMGYTKVIPTEMLPEEQTPLLYDPTTQTVLDMGEYHNTRSNQVRPHTVPGGADWKVVNDDKKYTY